jgi:hypothetical protein
MADETNKVEKLFEMLRVAASADNPAQSIVDAIDTLKVEDEKLWSLIDGMRSQMLESMNNLNSDDKIEILKEFKEFNGGDV